MRILVTGGAGFVGSELVRAALAGELPCSASSQVTVLDGLADAGNLVDLPGHPRFRFVQGDVWDPDVVDDAVSGQSVIVHFAHGTGPGARLLLEAARRHRISRFVHVSAGEPAGPEELALAGPHARGVELVITRCTNNYGQRQHPDEVIPLAVTNLLDGLRVPGYGTGVRDWLHVSDHCRGIQLVLLFGRPGEVYHIGGSPLSNVELTGRLLEACGASWDMVDQMPELTGPAARNPLDTTRIRDELGYAPRVGFAEGLAATVEWYRTHRSWWEPLKARRRMATLAA